MVTAVVTDPDGIDDLIGGNLTTPEGASAYGAFATAASEGAYSISLSWAEVNATQPITTELGAMTSRALRASFYDVSGHTVYRDIVVSMGCSGGRAACNGVCSLVNTDSSCGSCGHACPLPSQSTCYAEDGDEPFCYTDFRSTTRAACASQCQAPYSKCVGASAMYTDPNGGQNPPMQIPCAMIPSASGAMGTFESMTCFCAEP